jgi:putative CRISPR-associated protein (TIGR02619 family)
MKKLIICTAGTSIANSCPEQKLLIRKRTNWNDDISILNKEIRSFVSNISDVREISAEMNTLDRIGVGSSDHVVLLSSDNAPGRACSEALRQVIMEQFGLESGAVELKRIKGLQVRDSKLLREEGLKNFVKEVLCYLNDPQYQYAYETIINPTGGFKGILPFLTTLGMLYGKRIVYIFEFSDELINLPPLPFSFDLQLYDRVRPALQFIDKQVAVTPEAFLHHVVGFTAPEKDLFMAFTEPFEDGLITLSPLAYCLLSIETEHEHCLVTPAVSEFIKNHKGVSGVILKRLINNTENPLWRNSHVHRWGSTDLLIMKQPRTAERIAGFVKNDRFHVTHAFSSHDEYERTLGKYSKADFDNAEFIEWNIEDDLGVDKQDGNAHVDERDFPLAERDELEGCIKQLKLHIEEQKQEFQLVESKNEARISHLQKEINKLNKYIDELKEKVEQQGKKKHRSFLAFIFSLLKKESSK